ncbi:hypothetical protein PR048_004533 [Dryococelus australis]|uniref:Uncharacterized protein n=1 Tax=Dryococelus australis TaxID=614101 RepID=A0ABQ9I7L8_9NEOP|nr:hypothetical protein PR048_004533 [Dryococelus australis]
MPGKFVFSNAWLCRDVYRDWLRALKDKYAAKCCFCSKEFSVSSMGESAFKSHMKSKKHQDLKKAARITLGNLTLFPSSSGDKLHQASVPSVVSHILNNDVLDAEILWTFRTVHASYNSNENISKMLQKNCIKILMWGEKKSAYFAVFGIAPYFQNYIVEQLSILKKNYALLFDES